MQNIYLYGARPMTPEDYEIPEEAIKAKDKQIGDFIDLFGAVKKELETRYHSPRTNLAAIEALIETHENDRPIPGVADAHLLASGNAMLVDRCDQLAKLVKRAYRYGWIDNMFFDQEAELVLVDDGWQQSAARRDLAAITGEQL